MADQYPNDSDGGALRGVLANGSDMSTPKYIDFNDDLEEFRRDLAG